MIKKFRLIGLDCANCAAKIERDINALDGVSAATVNHLTEKLMIEAHEDRIEEIIVAAEKIVKKYESHVVMKKA